MRDGTLRGMTAQRFEGKRASRPALLGLGLALLVVSGVVCLILGLELHARAAPFLPWIGMSGAGAFFVLMILSMVPGKASVTVDDGQVIASWRRNPLRRSGLRIAIGRWVMVAALREHRRI